jgi:hypothetical protein
MGLLEDDSSSRVERKGQVVIPVVATLFCDIPEHPRLSIVSKHDRTLNRSGHLLRVGIRKAIK